MSLLLKHTPGEWDGTFAVTVGFLVEDVLSDGEPIDVLINGEPRPRTLTAYEHNLLVFSDGYREDVLDVVAIEVP